MLQSKKYVLKRMGFISNLPKLVFLYKYFRKILRIHVFVRIAKLSKNIINLFKIWEHSAARNININNCDVRISFAI